MAVVWQYAAVDVGRPVLWSDRVCPDILYTFGDGPLVDPGGGGGGACAGNLSVTVRAAVLVQQ